MMLVLLVMMSFMQIDGISNNVKSIERHADVPATMIEACHATDGTAANDSYLPHSVIKATLFES